MTVITLLPARPEPQTHAFVVGIGHYRNLPGGGGRADELGLGLTQLSSPPISARAFTDWLLHEHHNPQAPLGSVELLISDDLSNTYTLPNGTVKVIEVAKISNIERAFTRWYDRCNRHANNVAIFFFCGHGLSVRGDRLLLAEDIASNPLQPLAQSINLDAMHRGMYMCRAETQSFFIDACQMQPYDVQGMLNIGAKEFITVLPGFQRPSASPWDAPIYNASMPGHLAYGRANEMTLFTRNLLLALGGLSSEKLQSTGQWTVTTGRLSTIVNDLVARAAAIAGLPQQSTTTGTLIGRNTLHICVDTPKVPIQLTLAPTEAYDLAELHLESMFDPARHYHRPPAPREWATEVYADMYHLSADFQAGRYQRIYTPIVVAPPECLQGISCQEVV